MHPPDLGYSKAIDMWSLGCITFLLLSGDHVFVNQYDPRYQKDPLNVIMDLASECNLDIIDNTPKWKSVGKRPKSFIKSLLVLSEEERLNAKQALGHPWFANASCAPEFERIYEWCIRDWRPRRKVFKLVERLSPSQAPARSKQISPFFPCAAETKAMIIRSQRSQQQLPNLAPVAEEDAESTYRHRTVPSLPSLGMPDTSNDGELLQTLTQLSLAQSNEGPSQDSIMVSEHSRCSEHYEFVDDSMDISEPDEAGNLDVETGEFGLPGLCSPLQVERVPETPQRLLR